MFLIQFNLNFSLSLPPQEIIFSRHLPSAVKSISIGTTMSAWGLPIKHVPELYGIQIGPKATIAASEMETSQYT